MSGELLKIKCVGREKSRGEDRKKEKKRRKKTSKGRGTHVTRSTCSLDYHRTSLDTRGGHTWRPQLRDPESLTGLVKANSVADADHRPFFQNFHKYATHVHSFLCNP